MGEDATTLRYAELLMGEGYRAMSSLFGQPQGRFKKRTCARNMPIKPDP